jgi:DNA-binding transcriptional ArsR family regulator
MSPKPQGMPETMYRASRYFRILGNPTAYLILRKLQKGPSTPSDLSEELSRSISTISDTLRNLRNVNLVRYETQGLRKVYGLKDPKVLAVLDKGEELAEIMRRKER